MSAVRALSYPTLARLAGPPDDDQSHSCTFLKKAARRRMIHSVRRSSDLPTFKIELVSRWPALIAGNGISNAYNLLITYS